MASCLYSLAFKLLAFNTIRMFRKLLCQNTCLVVQRSSFLAFFTFLLVNQNIDAQSCTHVKNHHHHMNYLTLDYSIYLTEICSNMWMLLVKGSPKKITIVFFLFLNPNCEWTHSSNSCNMCQKNLDKNSKWFHL